MSIELYPADRRKRRNIPCENPEFRKGPFIEERELLSITLEGSPLDPIDLTGKWGNNYTHWVIDVFGKALLAAPEMKNWKAFIADDAKECPFVKEFIDWSDLELVKEPEKSCHVNHPLAYTSLVHPGLIDIYRRCFYRDATIPKFNLLIQRGVEGTGNTQSRNFAERHEIQRLFAKSGVVLTTVYLEGTSVFQQAALFNSAHFIIAAHGSALTNIMFCKPECKVIEVASKSRHNQTYSDIASYLDFPMVVIEGEEKKLHGEDKDYCLSVDPQKLLKIATSL